MYTMLGVLAYTAYGRKSLKVCEVDSSWQTVGRFLWRYGRQLLQDQSPKRRYVLLAWRVSFLSQVVTSSDRIYRVKGNDANKPNTA